MTLCDLCELPDLVCHAYARNATFFVTLPHNLIQQEHCHRSWQRFSHQTKDPQ
jgi:hypothetical protein